MLFLKYFFSNIILRIEKKIYVKKQKQTRGRTQGRGGIHL